MFMKPLTKASRIAGISLLVIALQACLAIPVFADGPLDGVSVSDVGAAVGNAVDSAVADVTGSASDAASAVTNAADHAQPNQALPGGSNAQQPSTPQPSLPATPKTARPATPSESNNGIIFGKTILPPEAGPSPVLPFSPQDVVADAGKLAPAPALPVDPVAKTRELIEPITDTLSPAPLDASELPAVATDALPTLETTAPSARQSVTVVGQIGDGQPVSSPSNVTAVTASSSAPMSRTVLSILDNAHQSVTLVLGSFTSYLAPNSAASSSTPQPAGLPMPFGASASMAGSIARGDSGPPAFAVVFGVLASLAMAPWLAQWLRVSLSPSTTFDSVLIPPG